MPSSLVPGSGNFPSPAQAKNSSCFLSSVSLFTETGPSHMWWKSAGRYRPVSPTVQNMSWTCVPFLRSWTEGLSHLLPPKEIFKDTELKAASPKHWWTLKVEFPDTFDLFLVLAGRITSAIRLGHILTLHHRRPGKKPSIVMVSSSVLSADPRISDQELLLYLPPGSWPKAILIFISHSSWCRTKNCSQSCSAYFQSDFF